MTTALEFITAYDCRNCGGTGYIGGEVICPDCVKAQATYQAMRKAEQSRQMDSMFIQKSESGNVYHLCYTDSTREVISRARFVELSPLTQYEPEDGVYWFRSNYWMFAQTLQDAPRINGEKKAVLVSTKDYWKHINQARLVCVSRWQNHVEILRFWTYRAYNPTPSSWARIERYQAGVK